MNVWQGGEIFPVRSLSFQTMKIYCASVGFSGVWAFSAEAIKCFAPKQFLTASHFSTGEIWEAELSDLFGQLKSFSHVETFIY